MPFSEMLSDDNRRGGKSAVCMDGHELISHFDFLFVSKPHNVRAAGTQLPKQGAGGISIAGVVFAPIIPARDFRA